MKKMTNNPPRYAFFGTPAVAVTFLDALLKAGMPPALVISNPDRPAGRGLELIASPVAQWARAHTIPLVQPEKIDESFFRDIQSQGPWDVFLVVAYGVILPQALIEMPRRGTLNVHFSLLPRWRGASPVESAILAGDEETGAVIQRMRMKLDTGPVIALEKARIEENETAPELRTRLGVIGAELLVRSLPRYLAGELAEAEQNDSEATHAKKMKKEDGDITADVDTERWRKYRAYAQWPGTYFFAERNGTKIRVKVKSARWESGAFVIEEVVPEGKSSLSYEAFLRSGVKLLCA